MSLDNDVTMVLALNRISAIFGIFFKMLYATYSLDECLLLCEASQKCIREISRYLGICAKSAVNSRVLHGSLMLC